MIPPLFAVSLVVLFEALCFTTSLPVLNYYTEQLHGTGLWVGLMFALTAGPKVLTNPLWGGLSDRWGRRPVLALNTVGTFSGSVLWALAANGMPGLRPLAVLAISRGMVGAFGGQAGLAMAVAADTSTPERRAAAMGALGAAFSVALAIGPLLGGFVADRYSYAAVGWVCAVFQFTSLLVITFGLRETCVKRSTVGVAEAYRIPQTIWTQRVILVLAVVLITTTGLSEMNSTLGLMLEHDHGFTVRRTSYVFAFFGVLGALVQGGAIRPLVRRYGERAIVMVGLVITALGFGVMAAKLPSVGMWTAVGVLAIGASLARHQSRSSGPRACDGGRARRRVV
ncbi:MAG: MFS transporter [Planctomycetes bacterium]|nr:MFS transporter [Planctomycetota bacterium]